MRNYKKYVLNALLDSYENSASFLDRNKRIQRIYFHFSTKTIPEYFDETSVAYDEIHLEMEELERRGLVEILWKNKKRGHIVDKVSLRPEALDQSYAFVSRKKLDVKQHGLLDYMDGCRLQQQNETICRFYGWIRERLSEGQSIKSYVELDDIESFQDLVNGVDGVENNKEERFLRELSMELYGDSKKLEGLQRKIENVIGRFSPAAEQFALEEDIFMACNVVKNPSVLMMKGHGTLHLGSGTIDLRELRCGVGISSKDMEVLHFAGDEDTQEIQRIITVENLTTFYSAKSQGSLIIYLAGYHNRARRSLIQKAHGAYPKAKLFHWGDIDAGGFKIYLDLCRKTGLFFEPMAMDAATLERYCSYTRPLSATDKRELERFLAELPKQVISYPAKDQITEAIQWMLEHGRKLEQEIVEPNF